MTDLNRQSVTAIADAVSSGRTSALRRFAGMAW